ncbi:hypothetical protein PENTCL1PPCAC_8983 [Pristionchus entomophagus]|uniref:Uncharacterized protein n=1 Tax=Pristionchus entomophagus TaxID=358040 RepID=A0AAV5SUK9_9BILA|nr:hypothetical protein PENTCL1PPCAC_8983 [Pristionchus entomophagus]
MTAIPTYEIVPANGQCFSAQAAGECWCTSSCSPIPTADAPNPTSPDYVHGSFFSKLNGSMTSCEIAERAHNAAISKYGDS